MAWAQPWVTGKIHAQRRKRALGDCHEAEAGPKDEPVVRAESHTDKQLTLSDVNDKIRSRQHALTEKKNRQKVVHDHTVPAYLF